MRSPLRTLHLDGREFTWKATIHDRGVPRHIRVRVWGAGKNGCALQVDLGTPGREETYPFPTADDVRLLISHGLGLGWAPDTIGGTFVIPAAGAPALPALAVTDPLGLGPVG